MRPALPLAVSLVSLAVAVAVVFTAALASAQGPAPYGPAISLEQAKKVMAGAEVEANKNKWPVVQWGSIEIAKEKARSSVALRRPTKALQDLIGQGGANLRLLTIGYSVLEGGIPIIADGKIIGGIGVSGVTSQQDAQIGQAGIDALK
jgi:glc operon protein GlcG